MNIQHPAAHSRTERYKPTGLQVIPFAVTLICFCFPNPLFGENRPERPVPNILLFLCDDMGIGDVSAYQAVTGLPDNKQLHTPVFQRLADSGIIFTDAHSAAPLCSPSRWSLLSGRYPLRKKTVRYNLLHTQKDCLLKGETTLPTVLKRAGYRTYGAGKWHLGTVRDNENPNHLKEGPLSSGFDHFLGIEQNSRTCFFDDDTLATLNEHASLVPGDGNIATERLSQGCLNRSRKLLSSHLEKGEFADRPFFLYYAPFANHEPYQVPEFLDDIPVKNTSRTMAGEYALENIDLPMSGGENKEKEEASRRTYKGSFGYVSHPIHRSDMVLENDTAMGRLIHWLETNDDPRWTGHKMIDNTIIILSSDNGSDIRRSYMPPHGHLTGHKDSQFDGGHRVPFIISWPGMIPRKKSCNALICLTDIIASLSGLIGVQLKPGECSDSLNVSDAFLNPEKEIKRPASHPLITMGGTASLPGYKANRDALKKIWEESGVKDNKNKKTRAFKASWWSVRQDNWKLTMSTVDFRTGEGDPVALYNLSENIKEDENTNLLQSPECNKIVPSLQDLVRRSVRNKTK